MTKVADTETKEKTSKSQEDKDENQSVEIDRVGAILYNERMKKKIDLSEISQRLCIRRYYLEAIEKGEYGNLPSMPYSAGFVDSYAKYLGLNNARIVQLFKEELDIKPQASRNVVNDDVPSEAKLPRKSYVLFGVLGIALLSLIWKYSATPENVSENKMETKAEDVFDQEDVEYYQTVDKMKTEQEENAEEKAADDKEDAAKAEVKESAKDSLKENLKEDKKSAEKTEKEPAKEVAKAETFSGIEIKIDKEDTWLEVKGANKVYLSKTLKKGESYQLPDVEGLIVSSGKYDGVKVYVNGKLTPLFRKDRKTNIDLDKVLNLKH